MRLSSTAIRVALAENSNIVICDITGKISYASSKAAAAARKRHRKTKRGHKEQSLRSYECDCGYWHNTSIPLSEYKEKSNAMSR